jgi:O-antigen/teichoic acid export membrane protein
MNGPYSLLQRGLNRLKGDSLKSRVMRGSMLTLGGEMGSNLLRLVSNLVLTRLLFPEAFALMALVQTFITGLNLFSDTGIRASIIQNDRALEPSFLNTAWTLQVIRGVVIFLISCALAIPLANFYEEPLLASMLPVSAIVAVLQGFMPVRMFVANRELLLGRMTALNLLGQSASIIAMIPLALIYQSVWALVLGSLVGPMVKLILAHRIMPGHRERFEWNRPALGELVSFGKWILISTACTFLVNHADRAILGAYVTLDLLGIYSIAFFLANVPKFIGRPMTTKIVFPLYKQRPPSESAANRRKIFRMRRQLTAGLLGLAGLLAIFGDVIISTLYDDRYALAGPILVMLSMAYMPLIITETYPGLNLAAGDSKKFMIYMVSAATAQTLALVVGAWQFGLFGAAMAPGIAHLLIYPIVVAVARQKSGWDPLHDICYAIIAVLLCALAVWVNADAILMLWAA